MLAWVNGVREGVLSFLTGMRLTAAFLAENASGRGGATAITRQYPQEPAVTVGQRTRGHLKNDVGRCIACGACVRACPVDCIVLDPERNEDGKLRPSRFDLDVSRCISCNLCVRACPADCLGPGADFQVDPAGAEGRYVFRRTSAQLSLRLSTADMARLHRLAREPRAALRPEDAAWLAATIEDPAGTHLASLWGLGYYTPEEKARVEREREERRKAKEAAGAAKAAADGGGA